MLSGGDCPSPPIPLASERTAPADRAPLSSRGGLLRHNNRWLKPSGTTATTHILKPAIGRLPIGLDLTHSVENEYLCLKLTAALGLPSAEAEMANFDGIRTLIVKRFDRRWTRDGRLLRVPQEDCCQALSVPPSKKYESDGGPGIVSILKLLQGSDEPETDQTLFLKALIVFWLLGATDCHAKNFSVFLSPGGRFRLTPIYDVISLQPSVDASRLQRNKMKFAMAVGDKRHYVLDTITPRHFVQTAAMAGVGFVQPIFDELRESARTAIDRVIGALPGDFPERTAKSVSDGFLRRLRQLDAADT